MITIAAAIAAQRCPARVIVTSAVTTAKISGGTSWLNDCTTRYPAAVTTSTGHG